MNRDAKARHGHPWLSSDHAMKPVTNRREEVANLGSLLNLDLIVFTED